MDEPVPVAGSGLRASGAGLLGVSVALTLGGSFAPLMTSSYDRVDEFGSPTPTSVVTSTWTAWTYVVDPPVDDATPPFLGYGFAPVAGHGFAAGMIAVALALVVLTVTGRGRVDRSWGRAAGVGAAALLAGVLAQHLSSLLDRLDEVAALKAPDFRYDVQLGWGAWLLFTGLLCAAGAIALLLLSARSAGPPPPDTLRGARSILPVVGAGSMLVAVAFVLGGCFAPLATSIIEFRLSEFSLTMITSAWTARIESSGEALGEFSVASTTALLGPLLLVGVVSAVVSAVVLAVSTRGRGRSACVGAAALLVGVIGQEFLDLLNLLRAEVMWSARRSLDSSVSSQMIVGAGAWLLLAAAVCAAGAAVTLLVSARSQRLQPAGFGPTP